MDGKKERRKNKMFEKNIKRRREKGRKKERK